MRIKVFYHESVEDLPSESRNIVKKMVRNWNCRSIYSGLTGFLQVVPDAVDFWESSLSVSRANSNIFLNRKCRRNQYFLIEEDPGEQVG